MFKIENTLIKDYFKEIKIVSVYKGDLDIEYEDSIFIDDNPFEIESILKNNPRIVIRLLRGKYKNQKLNLKCEIVNNLLEINFDDIYF